MNDIANLHIRSKIDKMKIPDISKSAHNRSHMPHLSDNRRIKSSAAQRELNIVEGLSADSREDSFILQYQKQLLPRNSFSGDQKPEKANSQSVIIRRKTEEKLRNPDRITLDRQNMTACPILENEDNLRLLNYQYNHICHIEHLEKLRKLILLDLYDNRIEKISGLDSLKSLRVLMLGRNRIIKIDGLESLSKLDVLDLHANGVERIENLNHLSELRVLNLAGNNIHCLDNLHGLVSLTEINVRRNRIETVTDVNSYNCPNLQRVYLSFNNIVRIIDFSCLIDLASLNELSLDNNPICRHNHIRSCVVHTFPQLQQLDAKIITDDERYRSKQIVNRLDSATKSNSNLSRQLLVGSGKGSNADSQSVSVQRFNSLKERRRSNINNSRRVTDNWGQSGKSVSPRLAIKCFSGTNKSDCASNSLFITDTSNNNVSDSDRDVMARSMRLNSSSQDLVNSKEFHAIQDTLIKHPHQVIQLSSQSSPQKNIVLRPSSASSTTSKNDVSKSFILSENSDIQSTTVANNDSSQSDTKSTDDIFLDIVIETEQISFYSPTSFKKFDDKDFWTTRPTLSTTITSLVFRDVDFSVIEKNFTPIKARFPAVKKMVFYSCNLNCYSQINSLANLKRLEELIIDKVHNPIADFTLIRFYVAFRLAHLGLRRFNDLEITESEFLSGRRYFLPLAIIGPGQVLQLHLIGLISDTRRRELLHSTNDSMTSMTMNNFSCSQTPSVNLDLVGKSGLLAANSLLEHVPNIDPTLSSLAVESVICDVDRECTLEDKFHEQWVGILWRMVLSRMQSMAGNRHEYMRRQYDQLIANKSKVTTKSASVVAANRK